MHGRLKVRTTEQELALKRQKQQKRVVAYRAAMQLIRTKRDADEYDAEMLTVTGELLAASPDINTLWNVRRECLLRLQRADPATDAFRRDLEFTLVGLQSNPKSYCAWHHRRWCLETCAEPDWTHELELCTKFLKLDERNFHVWDHRSYVAQVSAVPAANELIFCTSKINDNFSNYSSWHYRSKLLPQLRPHPTDAHRPIDAPTLRFELDMVMDATFTAPEDSSAWFYQRWLLGYSAPALDIAAFKVTATRAIVTFSTPVNLRAAGCQLRLDAQTQFETRNWRPVGVGGDSATHSTIWTLEDSFALNADSGVEEYELEFIDELGAKHWLPVYRTAENLIGIKKPRFVYDFEATVREDLEKQLRSYEELRELQRDENEPDSKWALHTTALMMRAIDRRRYHSKTLDNLAQLHIVDPMRTGYYADLADKWNIENLLNEWINIGDLFFIDLRVAAASALYYDQYLCVADAIRVGTHAMRPDAERKMGDIYAACGVLILRD